jgi:hypothetical protein
MDKKRKNPMNDLDRFYWDVWDTQLKGYVCVYSYEEYLASFPKDKRPEDKRPEDKRLERVKAATTP